MNAKHYVKLVHEGEYVAEADVELAGLADVRGLRRRRSRGRRRPAHPWRRCAGAG